MILSSGKVKKESAVKATISKKKKIRFSVILQVRNSTSEKRYLCFLSKFYDSLALRDSAKGVWSIFPDNVCMPYASQVCVKLKKDLAFCHCPFVFWGLLREKKPKEIS